MSDFARAVQRSTSDGLMFHCAQEKEAGTVDGLGIDACANGPVNLARFDETSVTIYWPHVLYRRGGLCKRNIGTADYF